MSTVAELILVIPVLLLSLSIHEYSHGKMADLLGDPTPRATGRLTLNPLAHLDLMGTLVLLMTRRFGWAKPVQVNPRYFSNPRRDMMYVGMAGPASNFVQATIFALVFRIFQVPSVANALYNFGGFQLMMVVSNFFFLAIIVNLALGVFNLIPVPPLDGSRILVGILPRQYEPFFRQLEGWGMFIILFLALTGILGRVILPFVNIFARLLGVPI